MQLIQPNNKKISSKNIRNQLRAQSCKGRALRDSKFVSERQTNKHRQEIKTNISLTQVRKNLILIAKIVCFFSKIDYLSSNIPNS